MRLTLGWVSWLALGWVSWLALRWVSWLALGWVSWLALGWVSWLALGWVSWLALGWVLLALLRRVLRLALLSLALLWRVAGLWRILLRGIARGRHAREWGSTPLCGGVCPSTCSRSCCPCWRGPLRL